MLQWLCRSPQYILRESGVGTIIFAFFDPGVQAPSRLPVAASPTIDQPVALMKFLLSILLVISCLRVLSLMSFRAAYKAPVAVEKNAFPFVRVSVAIFLLNLP